MDYTLKNLRVKLQTVLPETSSGPSSLFTPASNPNASVLEELKRVRDQIETATNAVGAEKEGRLTVKPEKMQQLLGRRLRNLLLAHLASLTASPAQAETELSSFFSFGIACVQAQLLANEDILSLFEDLYECCPEKMLSTLFPLFERAIHGSQSDASDKIELRENQTHTCTKICRLIMTKLTVTHDLQLRGALLRFVARTLPLTHPSGKKNQSQAERRREQKAAHASM